MNSTTRISTDHDSIDRKRFYMLVVEQLLPFFSGAEIVPEVEDSSSRSAAVAFKNPCAIALKPTKDDTYSIVVRRRQRFAAATSDFVSEHGVASAFVSSIQAIKDAIGEHFERDLLSTIKRRIVVRAVCGVRDNENTVLSVVDQFDIWSTQLYEGQPISAAVGFDPYSGIGEVSLREVWLKDFSSVLSNGFDTILTCDYEGKATGYQSLPVPDPLPPYSPHRLSPIAEWSKKEGRIAIALNRTGEILVIRNGQLVFTRRGGYWHFLTLRTAITQMKCPQNREVRKAVMESCLDASFARTGACIGVFRRRHEKYLPKVAPMTDDHIAADCSPKNRLISMILNDRKFQDLNRNLRQELLAIDGATLLSYDGRVLAVGAILNIEGGSTGGGRLAAAKELSKYGTGIKVSQDGRIEAYYRRNHDTPEEEMRLAFSLM